MLGRNNLFLYFLEYKGCNNAIDKKIYFCLKNREIVEAESLLKL